MTKIDDGYALVRLDDSIVDKAVLSYDASKDMIVDSGLIAHRGTLDAAAGTVSVGLQEMSSAGEQVIWRNRNTQVNYAPPWAVIDEIDAGGSKDRFYGTLQTQTRFSIDADVLENPEFPIHIPQDEVVFRLIMDFPDARDDIVFRITQNGHEMWREIKNVSAGLQTISLNMPISFYTGDFVFSIKTHDSSALPVKVKGNLQTGEVAYKVVMRPFTEKTLATQEFVLGQGGAATNYMQKSVYDSDNDGVVDKAERVQGVEAAASSSYYGKDASGSVGFHKIPDAVDLSKVETDIKANKDELDKHATSITNHGTQIATNTGNIADLDTQVQQATSTANNAMNAITITRNNMVSGITITPNNTAKTLTVRLTSRIGTVVATEVVDLSSWFSSAPPSSSYTLYTGFDVDGVLDAQAITSTGTQKTTNYIDGLSIDVTRLGAEQSYIWVWIPDAAGAIKGFSFSGFVSVWKSTQVTVNNVSGRLYISPNQTTSKSVTFEVITR